MEAEKTSQAGKTAAEAWSRELAAPGPAPIFLFVWKVREHGLWSWTHLSSGLCSLESSLSVSIKQH